jgi:NAD(P)-dependent dehydrogenase (short-subunit alcohol dehydrogenase family)
MSENNLQSAGKVAIVTGGGRGFGRAMAEALAADGATVAVTARSADQLAETVALITQKGGRAAAFMADVIDSAAVKKMVADVEQKLGPIDILVNNAGVGGPVGPAWENDPDEWWRILEVNVHGPFLCAMAVLPAMISRRKGRIINIASGAGIRPLPHNSSYSVSKTALVRFTECLALETKEYGVQVFTVRPGLGRTAITEKIASSPEGQKWMPEIAELLDKGEDLPMERVSQLVLFLSQGQADALTGRYFMVHDDETELVGRTEEILRDDLLTLKLCT